MDESLCVYVGKQVTKCAIGRPWVSAFGMPLSYLIEPLGVLAIVVGKIRFNFDRAQEVAAKQRVG